MNKTIMRVAFRSDATPFGPFAIQLADTSDKALTSLALPTAIDFSAFSSNTVSSYSMGFFNATLTQFAPAGAANSAVPEPATTALFALALAGLAAARRRRARQNCLHAPPDNPLRRIVVP